MSAEHRIDMWRRGEPWLRRVAIAAAIAGCLARLAWALVVWINAQTVEAFEYEEIAHNLLAGRGYGLDHLGTWHRNFGSPPFSYLCAFVYGVSGSAHGAMLMVQAVCSAVTTWGCYRIGRRLFSSTAGWVAAAFVALHPGLFLYDTHKIHPLGFDTMLAVLGLLAVLTVRERATRGTVALAGGLHGLALLERSTFVGLVPLAVAALWRAAGGRRGARLLLAYGVAVAVIPGAWAVRNTVVYQRPMFSASTTSAEVFWLGNNPLASGGAFAEGQPGVKLINAAPESLKQRVMGQDEFAQSRVFWREAMSFIRDHPVEALRLYAKKLGIFAWFGRYSGYLYPAAYLVWYQRYYAVMLVLGLLGVLALLRDGEAQRRRGVADVAIFLVSVALLQSLCYVEIRHRWSVEPLLLVLAAGGSLWIGAVRRRSMPGHDPEIAVRQEERFVLGRASAGERM